MKAILREHPYIQEWAILLAYRGSVAHGMYVPDSDPNGIDDKDVMGVCVPPEEYYYGLRTFGSRGTKEIKEGVWDVVLYELTKAVRLLEKGNPNVLCLLWLDENMYLKTTPAGRMLIEHRDLFVGKHVYYSFVGYAKGQLHKMTHGSFNGYMGAKRKALVEKFGFDTKNAAHLIRLLRMGIEFLSTGHMQVTRPDAQELLAIKRGEWALERVHEEASRQSRLIEEALVRSSLPDKPDHDKVNALCVEVARRWRSPHVILHRGAREPPEQPYGPIATICKGEPPF